MIKINLLPVKRKRRPKVVPPKLPVFPIVIGLIFALAVSGYRWFSMESNISTLRAEKSSAERKLIDLKVKIREVEDFEKDNKRFEEKTDIIEQLRKNQSGPVCLLDEVSKGIPERLWLSALNESGGTVTLDGLSFSNSDIVTFVGNLKASPYLTDVALIESRQTTQEAIAVYQFKLTFRVKV